MRIILMAFLGWTALFLFMPAYAADETQTIVIVDATAQMTAPLGQQRKIDLVKGSVNAAVSRMGPASSLSLWAFGTNPQKKCEDIGELVPLKAASLAVPAFEKALSPIQPKAARAPAFDTVQSALRALGEGKDKPASIVLIAGTGDDCVGDICSSAERLHAVYPQAKLTVLGLRMGDQAAANFACAAKAMGGGFTAVKSGADLDRTLRQALNIGPNQAPQKQPSTANVPGVQAEKSIADKNADSAGVTSAAPPDSQPAQQDAEEKHLASPAPQPEPNTILSAVLATSMPPLDAGVTWEIYKVTLTPTGQTRVADAPTWTSGGGQAKIKLPEGRYLAQAAYGYATATDEFTVAGEKTEKTISLEAGTIAAEAFQTRDGPSADGTFFVLYRRKTAVALEELGRSSETPALFHVNAGDYVLSASAGLAKLETNVKVEAGKVSAVRLALNVGTLEIKTSEVSGTAQSLPVWHRIYSLAADSTKAMPLLRVAGATQRVQLPAGSYRLETIYGNASEESVASVTAGQVTQQVVALNAGEAKVSLPAGKTDKVCAVYEAGTDHQADPIARAAGSEISFVLKAGLYDLECRGKGATAPTKQAQIRVVAGETQSAKIEE